ncbi:MAG: carbohydrate porin [Deltaproteobacteria bacterium]|nr:carbohydrate porin [Deltaproteobacteria bacterium]MBW2361774.1 carbohydrate porin [Deltaproteobacteria bacterium]
MLPLAVVLAAAPAGAQADIGTLARHVASAQRLLGDFGGARSRTERFGIAVELFSTQTSSWKLRGGAEKEDDFGHSASYDLFTLIDFEALAGWRGLSLLFHAKGQYARDGNAKVGALSDPVDDADFDEAIYVGQLWLEQRLWKDRLRLRVGYLDQQVLFDRNAYANSEDRQFLATFLDNNPVVPLAIGLGSALILSPFEGVELALGAGDADNVPRRTGFDTAFDGLRSVTGYLELTLRTRLSALALPGTYRLGSFVDGSSRERFGTGRSDRGHWGAYLSFDQLAYREGAKGEEGLGLFARFGYADPDVNRIEWFWSVGFQYLGLLPRRGEDALGMGMYQTIGSRHYRDAVDPRFRKETGIELYYRISPYPWLALTPDLQYIVDPGATGEADDAFQGALRFRVAF